MLKNMKTKLELSIFVIVVAILIGLRLPLESSDIFILPFLILVLLRLSYLIQKRELSLKSEVLNFNNNGQAILYYGVFTVAAIIFLWFLRNEIMLPAWLKGHGNAWLWFMPIHILFQEIIFRTYLINRLKVILNNPWYISIISAIIFAAVHFVLPDAQTVALLTLISGFVWSYLYQKYPNLIYVWFSHYTIDLFINFAFVS